MLSTKSKIFKYFLLCFITGIVIASYFFVNYWYVYLILVFLGCGYLFFKAKNKKILILVGFCFIIIGFCRYQTILEPHSPNQINYYNGQSKNFVGLVSEPPDQRINQTKLTLKVLQADGKKIGGLVLVTTSPYPQYQYGDLLSVNCQLQAPENFEDFNYQRYLAKDNIYSTCQRANINLLQPNHGDILLNYVYRFKEKLQDIINTNLPEPHASLLSAIILGSRRGVPQDLTNQFSITGTSHLIAISGLHITLIITILMELALAFYLPRKKAFIAITIFIIFYLTIIGYPPSAVRASIMAWLYIFAMVVGRLNNSSNSVLLAASLMLLINPKILRDDLGFQLSFCAVLGLIYFLPLIKKYFEKFPEIFGIREGLAMTTAAQITTMPLIIFSFNKASLIAPIVNVLVLPVLPFLMIVTFVALAVSMLFPMVGLYIFWPVYLFLSYLITSIQFFAGWPLAAINF